MRKFANYQLQISAVDSLLTPMLVVVRHKYLKIISAQRLKKEIEQKPISSEEHMKQFVLDWKVDL